MNKSLYRLIFNRRLGKIVVVSEVTPGCRKAGGQTSPSGRTAAAGREVRFSWVKSGMALAALAMIADASLAQSNTITPVAGANGPGVSSSSTGRSVIEITRPNGSGLSYNQFQQLNLPSGAIFNNSTANGVSASGGQVLLNPNLGGGQTARAIVTEVMPGGARTTLGGTNEVFGAKADLIVANPAGISVNGASFINARSFTAAAGSITDASGAYPKVSVTGGGVEIGGSGLNAQGLSYVDIVGKTISVNGPVAGDATTDVRLIAGENAYDTGARTYVSGVSASSGTAISGSAAGAMYGGNIQLISTDSGAGVTQLGLLKSPGSITVSAAGDVSVRQANAQTDLALSGANVTLGSGAAAGAASSAGAAAHVSASGSASFQSNLSASTLAVSAGAIDVSQSTLAATSGAADALKLSAGDALNITGTVIPLNATGGVVPGGSVIVSGDTIQVFDANGNLVTGGSAGSTAGIVSAGGVIVNAGSIGNAQGRIYGASGVSLSTNAGAIANTGEIESAGTVSLTAPGLSNGFLIQSAGNIVSSANVVSNSGLIRATGDATLNLSGRGSTNSGTVEASNLTIESVDPGIETDFDNQSSGTLHAANDLLVSLDALTNSGSSYSGSPDHTGNSVYNVKSTILNNGAQVTALSGMLAYGNMIINADNLTSTNTIWGTTGVGVNVAYDIDMSAQAALISNGDLAINVGRDFRNAGLVQADHGIAGKIAGTLSNTGADGYFYASTVSLEGGSISNAGGATIEASGQVTVKADSGIDNNGGTIVSDSRSVSLDADTISNTNGGMISGATTAAVSAATSVTNSGAIIRAGQNTLLQGETISNADGGRIEGQYVIIDPTVLLSNSATIAASGEVDVINGNIVNGLGGSISAPQVHLHASGDFSNDGSIVGTSAVSVYANAFANTGTIGSNRAIAISADEYTNTGGITSGSSSSTGDAMVTMRDGNSLDITATRKLPVATGVLTLNAYDIIADSETGNVGSIVANAAHDFVDNQSVVVGRDLTVNAANNLSNNQNALLWAARNIALSAGTLLSNVNGAQILATNDLAIAAPTVTNDTASIAAGRDAYIDAAQLNNRSTLTGTVDMTSTSQSIGHKVDPIFLFFNSTTDVYAVTPVYVSNLGVTQGSISADRNLFLNEFSAKDQGSTINNYGLISAGNNLQFNGNLNNLSLYKPVPVLTYLLQPVSGNFINAAHNVDARELNLSFGNLYDLLAHVFGNVNDQDSYAGGLYHSGHDEQADTLKLATGTPVFNALMAAIFTPTWRSLSASDLSDKWHAFVSNPASVPDQLFYPNLQSTLAAGNQIVQDAGSGYIRTGDNANSNSNNPVSFTVGSHTTQTLQGDFSAVFPNSSVTPRVSPIGSLPSVLGGGHLFSVGNGALSSATNLPSGTVAPAVQPLYVTSNSYVNQANYYGSSYFFGMTGYNPSTPASVIGDAYFDNQLIQSALQNQVGAFLTARTQYSGADLVKSLIDAGVSAYHTVGLTIGEPLTDKQQAALTTDIVWYVSEVVNGQSVMVPEVFLCSATIAAISAEKQAGGAAIVAGNTVSLNANADGITSTNSFIGGANGVSLISAGDITERSTGGTLAGIESGGSVTLAAGGDVNIIGGQVTGDAVKISGNRITDSTTMGFLKNGTEVSRGDGAIYGASSVSLDARGALTMTGGFIGGGDVSIKADSLDMADVHAVGSTFKEKNNQSFFGFDTMYTATAFGQSQGSAIQATNLNLNVTGDATLKGASIDVEDTARLNVGGTLLVATGVDVGYSKTVENVGKVTGSFAVGAGAQTADVNMDGADGVTTYAGSTSGLSSASTPIQNDGGNISNQQQQQVAGVYQSTAQRAPSRLTPGYVPPSSPGSLSASGIGTSVGYTWGTSTRTENTLNNVNSSLTARNLVVTSGVADIGGADINDGKDASYSAAIDAGEIRSTKYLDTDDVKTTSTMHAISAQTNSTSGYIDQSNQLGALGTKVTSGGQSLVGGDAGNGVLMGAEVAGAAYQTVMNTIQNIASTSSNSGYSETTTSSSLHTTNTNTNRFGGNLTLKSAGDVTLQDVSYSTEGANLDIEAGGSVSILSGQSVTNYSGQTSEWNIGVGANAGGGATGVGMTIGVNGGVFGDSRTYNSTLVKNSEIDVGSASISSGHNFTLSGSNITADTVKLDVAGDTTIESVQSTSDMSHSTYNFNASVGLTVAASVSTGGTQFGVGATGSVSGGYGSDYDNSRLTTEVAGIKANHDLSISTGNNLNLTGAYIEGPKQEDSSSTVVVGNQVIARDLQDTRNKDGGFFQAGLSVTVTEGGGAVGGSLSAGRTDQVHYAATQQATIADASLQTGAGVNGHINNDASHVTNVTDNRYIAGETVSFDIPNVSWKNKGTPNKTDASTQTDPVESGSPGGSGARYVIAETGFGQVKKQISEISSMKSAELAKKGYTFTDPDGASHTVYSLKEYASVVNGTGVHTGSGTGYDNPSLQSAYMKVKYEVAADGTVYLVPTMTNSRPGGQTGGAVNTADTGTHASTSTSTSTSTSSSASTDNAGGQAASKPGSQTSQSAGTAEMGTQTSGPYDVPEVVVQLGKSDPAVQKSAGNAASQPNVVAHYVRNADGTLSLVSGSNADATHVTIVGHGDKAQGTLGGLSPQEIADTVKALPSKPQQVILAGCESGCIRQQVQDALGPGTVVTAYDSAMKIKPGGEHVSTSASDTDGLPGGVYAMPDDVHSTLKKLDTDPSLAGVQYMAGSVIGYLEECGIKCRLGGSLAARSNGGARQPQDIDIEVPDASSLQAAMTHLNGMNTIVTHDGITALMEGRVGHYATGMGGQAEVTFTSPAGDKRTVSIDVTNENNPAFNLGLISPQERHAVSNVVAFPELLVNYVDRMIKKPATSAYKGDDSQIISMLEGANFNPFDQSHVDQLRDIVNTHVQPAYRDVFKNKIEEIVNAAILRASLRSHSESMDVSP